LFSFLGHLDLWAWLFNSRKCSLRRVFAVLEKVLWDYRLARSDLLRIISNTSHRFTVSEVQNSKDSFGEYLVAEVFTEFVQRERVLRSIFRKPK